METADRDVLQTDDQDLKEVAGAFAKWRAERRPGARIPQELWERACSLHPRYSLFHIVRTLHLDYVDLRNRVQGGADRNGSKPSAATEPVFVELPRAPGPKLGTAEATVRLKEGRSVRIRIRLKAVAVEALVQLLHEIWKR